MLDMNDLLEFDAVLDAVEGIEALSVNFPYDVQEVYGVRGLSLIHI